MPRKLHVSDRASPEKFSDFLVEKREVSIDVEKQVANILGQVRQHGDEAVLEYTRRFDHVDYNAGDLRLSAAELDQAMDLVP